MSIAALPSVCPGCGGSTMRVGSKLLMQHRHPCAAYASAIEARSGETTQIGSAEGESAVGVAETPNPSRQDTSPSSKDET
jgi:hypothetical protein